MVINFNTRIPHSFLKYYQICYGNMQVMIRSCVKTMNIQVLFEKVFILNNKHKYGKYVLGLKRENIYIF